MGRYAIITAVVAALLVADFYFVYLHPSLSLCRFIQAVTVTRPQLEVNQPLLLSGQGVTPAEVDRSATVAPFAADRFTAKQHVTNQFQLWTDYPVSYFIAVDLGMIHVPSFSANLVSLIHPFFGFLAGYFIYRAATSYDRRVPLATDDTVAAGAVALQVGSPTADAPMEDEEKIGLSGEALRQAIDVRQLRIAAALMCVRNLLDTLDGVVARLQRLMLGTTSTGTSFGLNGHTVDSITDFIGVVFCMSGIVYLLIHKRVVISRLPSHLLSRLGCRLHQTRPQLFAKIVCTFGILLLGLVGIFWGTFMLRYANLFDVHAPTNKGIFELEQNFHVRLNQFLWSLSCGDALLTLYVIAMVTNRVWEMIQVNFFLGYFWTLLLYAHSNIVWHFVIVPNPAAAAVFAKEPLNEGMAMMYFAITGSLSTLVAVRLFLWPALSKARPLSPKGDL